MTPDERHTARVLAGRIGGNRRWAHVQDRTAETAPAHQAFMSRFEREVDPDGVLSTQERARRAENARKAYFAELALRSAQVRRRRREQREGGAAA
jgi:hypothetical protein